MKSLTRHLINLRTFILNLFKKNESIDESKMKWNTLAKKDASFYIMTNKSKSDSEENFKQSGEEDVKKFFLEDEVIRGVIGYDKKATVLEVGCGTGRLSEFIAPHVAQVYGVDISEEMISRAKDRLKDLKNIHFVATDGLSFPCANDSVDVLFSYIVFQHMPSFEVIRKNIQEAHRTLKSGGVVKIQLRGVPVSKDAWFYGPAFDRSEVERLLEGIPLSILKLEGEGGKYFWVWLKK